MTTYVGAAGLAARYVGALGPARYVGAADRAAWDALSGAPTDPAVLLHPDNWTPGEVESGGERFVTMTFTYPPPNGQGYRTSKKPDPGQLVYPVSTGTQTTTTSWTASQANLPGEVVYVQPYLANVSTGEEIAAAPSYKTYQVSSSGAAEPDTLDMYVGQTPQTLDVLANDTGLDTITAASISSGGDGTAAVSHDGLVLTITPRASEGTLVISYDATGPASAAGTGTATITVYGALASTGVTELTATETETQEWYGFSFYDADLDDIVDGIFAGGKNPVLVKDSGDARITIVDNNPVGDDSGGGFVATATFSATDDFGQSAGPVEITFTVNEKLAVSINGASGTVSTEGDDTIELVYDSPVAEYDITVTRDPATITGFAPQLWDATVGPKIISGVGYPGLWINDAEPDVDGVATNPMTLTYEWLNADNAVMASGTVAADTDWTKPSTAVVLKITGTDNNGTTVKRSDDEATADVWAFTGSTVVNIPATEGWAFDGSVVVAIPEGA